MRSLYEYLLDELAFTEIVNEARKRKNLKDSIVGHIYQIIENWALLIYFRDTQNTNIKHWSHELMTQYYDIVKHEIKCSKEAKTKLYQQVIINDEKLNNSEKIYKNIFGKLKKENISDINSIKAISEYIADNIDVLINVLSNENIDEWIENLINKEND